jgi:hypothetical protein
MTTTFLPVAVRSIAKPGVSGVNASGARDDAGELAQVEREAGGRPRAAERTADAVVAAAVADRAGLARREHRERRAVVVMIAAQVGEIDVQRLDLRLCRAYERGQRRQRVGDRRHVGKLARRAREHLVGGAVERRQRAQRVAPRARQPRGERIDRRRVLGAHRLEHLVVVAVVADAGAVGERAIDGGMAEVEVQARDAGRRQRRQQERDDLAVTFDAGLAEELGAELDHLARRAARRGARAQHAAGVAQPRDARRVEEMRVDARDLRRDVGAQREHPARERVHHLERLQLEVATGTGGERLDVLDHRRAHQRVAVRGEVVEQRAAQPLDAQRLVGQEVLDALGEQPVTHARAPGTARPRRWTRGR